MAVCRTRRICGCRRGGPAFGTAPPDVIGFETPSMHAEPAPRPGSSSAAPAFPGGIHSRCPARRGGLPESSADQTAEISNL